jgi:hypothetical protein
MKMWNVTMGVVLSLALVPVGPRAIVAQTEVDSRGADHVSGKIFFPDSAQAVMGQRGKGMGI